MPFEKCFKGKRVLVTGAGRGIGRALSKRLYSYGAIVYALSRTPEHLDTLNLECPQMNTITLDLGKDWDKTHEVITNLGPLDFVINNAAILISGSCMTITPQDFDQIFNVNIKAAINVSQAAAKNMIKAGIPGSILNFSSIASTKAYPIAPLYCLTKATMDMLTKLLAVEFGPHSIRVNSINPVGIDTGMLNEFYDGAVAAAASGTTRQHVRDDLGKKSPTGSFEMEMDEVVNASLFMVSRLAPVINGESLFLDNAYRHAP